MTDTTGAAFSYDETLLHEGKYREWFYQGMDESGLGYLRVPAKVLAPPPAEPIYKNQEFSQVRGWRDNAACKDTDPVVFFGKEGGNLRRQYLNPDAKWRQLCPQCPVRSLCLELARESKSEGIFGGKVFLPGPGERRIPIEYDESTMPKRGRPFKVGKIPERMRDEDRDRIWQEKQKEINDRISAAQARESQRNQ